MYCVDRSWGLQLKQHENLFDFRILQYFLKVSVLLLWLAHKKKRFIHC